MSLNRPSRSPVTDPGENEKHHLNPIGRYAVGKLTIARAIEATAGARLFTTILPTTSSFPCSVPMAGHPFLSVTASPACRQPSRWG